MPSEMLPSEADRLMATVQRQTVAMESLAALGAWLRADLEGLRVDSEVARVLDSIVTQLGFPPDVLRALPQPARRAAAGYIRSFLRQATELLDRPDRPPGWVHEDPLVLQAAGQSSVSIAPIIAGVARGLGDLSRRLSSPGACFLDVGTGVGALAIELARTFPAMQVVGIDVWQASLEFALRNVAAAGVDVVIRHQDVTALDDTDSYDAAFVAGPFLPADIVPPALARLREALRPGGWLLFGLYAPPTDDPLAVLLTDLRVVRGGGHPWDAQALAATLTAAGYADVREVERTWPAPVRLVVGRRP